MDHFDDETLVTRFQCGHQDTFDELMRRYKHKIYGYILRSVKNYEDAEELTIEVFYKVYKALHKWKPYAKFSTWLYRIAHNITIDHHRARKRRMAFSLDDEQFGIDEPATKDLRSNPVKTVIEKDRHRIIGDAIDQLSPNQKLVFRMNRYQGLQIREIAEILGMAEGTVKIHLHRAVRKLRVTLQPLRDNNEI